jgi:hypothetical protein
MSNLATRPARASGEFVRLKPLVVSIDRSETAFT